MKKEIPAKVPTIDRIIESVEKLIPKQELPFSICSPTPLWVAGGTPSITEPGDSVDVTILTTMYRVEAIGGAYVPNAADKLVRLRIGNQILIFGRAILIT